MNLTVLWKMLGSLKSFISSGPKLTRAVILSQSWGPSGYAAVRVAAEADSLVAGGLFVTIRGRSSGRWLDSCNFLCLLILQVVFLIYNMNWIFLIFCEDTEKLQTYLGWVLSEGNCKYHSWSQSIGVISFLALHVSCGTRLRVTFSCAVLGT